MLLEDVFFRVVISFLRSTSLFYEVAAWMGWGARVMVAESAKITRGGSIFSALF